jgi:hypothetical protein
MLEAVVENHSTARIFGGILPRRFIELQEERMRKVVILLVGGLLLLAGCGSQGTKDAGIPVGPKWKGAPYRIEFDTKAAKVDPAGITIPPIKFTANPAALETRAIVVLKFTAGSDVSEQLIVGSPLDIHGAEGTVPEDYMDRARKGLSDYLLAHCMKGKVELNVALARSSLAYQSTMAQADAKRLSDWMPLELVYKNPHPKCK